MKMPKMQDVWNFVASNEKINEFTKRPSKATAKDAIISGAIVFTITLAADLAAEAIWDGGKWVIKKIQGKGEKK